MAVSPLISERKATSINVPRFGTTGCTVPFSINLRNLCNLSFISYLYLMCQRRWTARTKARNLDSESSKNVAEVTTRSPDDSPFLTSTKEFARRPI